MNIDPKTCKEVGLITEQSVVDFWKKQPEETIKQVFSNPVPIQTALSEFSRWMGKFPKPVIWSHGAGFDPILLTSAYTACGMKPPWDFREVRDTRTLYDIVGLTHEQHRAFMPEGEALHNALSDVYMQARAVHWCINRIAVFSENEG